MRLIVEIPFFLVCIITVIDVFYDTRCNLGNSPMSIWDALLNGNVLITLLSLYTVYKGICTFRYRYYDLF